MNLENINEMQFMTGLNMGSQGDQRSLLVDTGSNVLWLTSELCAQDPSRCDNKHSKPYSLADSLNGRYYQEVKIGPDGGRITYYMPERTQAGEA